VRRPQTFRRRSTRGSAYLYALWGVFALSVLAVAAQGLTATLIGRASDVAAEAEALPVADALITRTLFALLDDAERARLPLDGTVIEARFEGRETRLQVQNVDGLINLNQAGIAVLRGLFEAAGEDAPEAARLAERLVEARRERAFAAPGDIQGLDGQGLDGISPALFARIAPALTVQGFNAAVDPWSAPRLVLRAVTGASESEIDAFILARRQSPEAATPEAFAGAPLVRSSARIVRLEAEVLQGRRVAARRVMVVRLEPRGYTLLEVQ